MIQYKGVPFKDAFFLCIWLNFAKKKPALEIPTQKIISPDPDIEVSIRREDLIHPFVSGNKYRKLKYNLLQAKKENKITLVTFGGAYSNHIAAVAYAGKQQGFETVGIIRGEELAAQTGTNPTLRFARQCGMKFEFVTREAYREYTQNPQVIPEKYRSGYLIPEGGTNALAVKGCEEILGAEDIQYDYICCAVGTGGTVSGLINCSKGGQQVLGFPALKGGFLQKDILKFVKTDNWSLQTDYHFGGYAKITPELVQFLNAFYEENKIPLDPVYTGKMVFGVMDLITKGYFPAHSKILLIHTGGLQGIVGMNQKLKSKNWPIIAYHD